jgi:methionyl-tRNA formyltransferase
MIFGKIDHIILLGGSRCTAELAMYLSQIDSLKFQIYTAPRQVTDVIHADGLTFGEYFKRHSLEYIVSEDINNDQGFIQSIGERTLGIGLGEAWSFKKEIIDKFNCRLIDLMGIRLPQYRGGAHYTWQILRGNRIGACNLQVINSDMIQGVFDSGEIIKFREYLFPPDARIPDDYFGYAVSQEISFIKEFIEELTQGKDFKTFKLQENFSIYFPRLHTPQNAFINWQWDTSDIEKFICAFDDPYAGATTQINGIMVRVKKARSEQNDGSFHPFQCGLIYKIYDRNIYVATRQGTIIISEVNNENGISIIQTFRNGDRFFTPYEWIEKGMTIKIEY